MPLAILQARMSSTRLPGKVLAPILGTPLILRTLERIMCAQSLDSVVLATSTDPSDDELVRVVEEAGVLVRRGSLDDVLQRFVSIIDEFEPDHVVRLTGDNPLTDPRVIDLVVDSHIQFGADYSSNSRPRTFPYGLDVECVSNRALHELAALSLNNAEREHVTLGIYTRPERFALHSVVQNCDHSDLRWSVDYPEDFAFVEAVYSELYESKPTFGQNDVIDLINRRPALRRTVKDVPA